MKPVIFPAAVGILLLVAWLAVALVSQCILKYSDPTFGCWHGMQLTAAFASIGAALAAVAAGVARALLHPFLSFDSVRAEYLSATLSAIVLVLVLNNIINWGGEIAGIAGMFFGGLVSGFLICCLSLLAVKRFSKMDKPKAISPRNGPS